MSKGLILSDFPFGPQSQGWLLRLTRLLNAVSSQLYYPTEHVAWAADNQIIAMDSSRLWVFSLVLWLLSLVSSLIQALATVAKVTKELRELGGSGGSRYASEDREVGSESSLPRRRVSFKDQETGARARLHALRQQRYLAALTAIKNLADMVNAINWLPPGILWSGKLSNFWIGFFGTVSSLIGLYRALPRRQSGFLKQT